MTPIRATAVHAPTPGYYAHVASSARSDSVVLDEHNGVPSLLILEIDDAPVLAWMIHGHGETAQIWIYLPLLPEEAGELVEHPDVLLARWVTERKGREAYLGMAGDDGVLVLVAPWRVPNVSPMSLIVDVVRAINNEFERALALSPRSELPEVTTQTLRKGERLSRQLVDVA